jgi:putative NADH-flavin reductase
VLLVRFAAAVLRTKYLAHQLASGYIGGTVLQRLLDHPKRDAFEITAVVRNADKAKVLNTLGVNTVVASLFDYDKVTELAAVSNVVINVVIRFSTHPRPDVVLKFTCRQIRTI